MANEITISVYGNLKNGAYIQDMQNIGNVSLTQAGNAISNQTYDMTTTPSALSKGAIGTIGYIWITNVGTGSVLLSMDNNTSYPISIPAGVTVFITPASGITITQWFLKMAATTGSAIVRMWEV